MPLQDLSEGPRTTSAPVPDKEECEGLFDQFLSKNQHDAKNQLSEDEQKKFRSSFADPKFREMLADYMEEISDPKYRAETEAYITQMEGDDQVPAGKELVRPEAVFVIKTHIVPKAKQDDKNEKGEKLFVNIVQSTQIAPPVGTQVKGGVQWSLPLSVGPKRYEADKGEALVVTFDACFHPEALKMVRENKAFRDYVVHTALDQVQSVLNPKEVKDIVRKEYHVLRGVTYKNGTPAIMMMQSDKMTQAQKQASSSLSNVASQLDKSLSKPKSSTSTTPGKEVSAATKGNPKKQNKKANKKGETAVKKGFLSSTPSTPSSTPTPPSSSLITEMSKTVSKNDQKQPLATNNTKPPPPPQSSSSSSSSSSSVRQPSSVSSIRERAAARSASHKSSRSSN